MSDLLTPTAFRLVCGFRLAVPVYWDLLTAEERREGVNGCGPDWFPDWLRRCLDWLSRFRPAAVVHDVEWREAIIPAEIVWANRRWWINTNTIIRQNIRRIPPVAVPTTWVWWQVFRCCYTLAVWIGTPWKYGQVLLRNR